MATFNNIRVSQRGHACNLGCFILGYDPAQSDMWLKAFRNNPITILPFRAYYEGSRYFQKPPVTHVGIKRLICRKPERQTSSRWEHKISRCVCWQVYYLIWIMDEKDGRGNRSTQRKPISVQLCPPQIPQDLTWAQTRRLPAWATSLPSAVFILGYPFETGGDASVYR
jgi:hypothetical protein